MSAVQLARIEPPSVVHGQRAAGQTWRQRLAASDRAERDLDRLVNDVAAGQAPLDELPPRYRHLAVQRLAALPAPVAAARLRCSTRTVARYRRAERAA